MRTVEAQRNRLVVKSDVKPVKQLTVEERLAALESENAALKARLAKIEKQKNPA